MRVTRKHGLSRTPEYRVWQQMRLRCTDPEHEAYADYGGRGITVCERWLDSPEAFLADMGPKPSAAHEIDRRDNDRGYEPDNCHWVLRAENCLNAPRNAIDWVIAGCESGTGARRCEADWFRSLRDQCKAAGVAFFLKQAVSPYPELHSDPTYWVRPDVHERRDLVQGPYSKRKRGGVIELPYLCKSVFLPTRSRG